MDDDDSEETPVPNASEPGAGPMRLVLLGPPGAGKGTQGDMLVAKLKLPRISTGDMLRAAVKSESALGREAKSFMDRGNLVPDRVVIGLVRERIGEPDCAGGFILDGFPRTVEQAESLEAILKERNHPLDLCVNIRVASKELVKRLSGRRVCKVCNALYHVYFDPPRNENICNKCAGELFQRDDDREDTIQTRLEVYEEQTAPLIRYYRDKGILRDVDGKGSVAQIFDRIVGALDARGQGSGE